jgi:hypothetical protein
MSLDTLVEEQGDEFFHCFVAHGAGQHATACANAAQACYNGSGRG